AKPDSLFVVGTSLADVLNTVWQKLSWPVGSITRLCCAHLSLPASQGPIRDIRKRSPYAKGISA
ncbi:MAG: hypothetical protein ACPGSB_02380, partial [Opitutales bacterium]